MEGSWSGKASVGVRWEGESPPPGPVRARGEEGEGCGDSCQVQVLTDGLGVGAGRSSGATSFLAWRPSSFVESFAPGKRMGVEQTCSVGGVGD